jgi:dihydrofolate synthase/folylpolyglutamate synthase
MKQSVDNFFRAGGAAVIKPGLERIKKLLELIGNPQHDLKVIQIAGTNGKGSFGCYCNAILAQADFRVGWFSSPHLVRRSELSTDETYGEISEASVLHYMEILNLAIDKMEDSDTGIPSEFERLTAMACLHFQAEHCDVVIMEAGMGGLEDATNIFSAPLVSVITALGFDHAAWLGADAESVASHKAGIIKKNRPVWLYDPLDAFAGVDEAEAALKIIQRVCGEKKAVLNIVSSNDYEVISRDVSGQSFRLKSLGEISFDIVMPAVYQPQLAAMAIAVCLYLLKNELGFGSSFINDKSSAKLLQNIIVPSIRLARWPGRFEVLAGASEKRGLVILDGAHNPQGCQALADTLGELTAGRRIIFLVGMLADKDVELMLQPLLMSDRYVVDSVICTTPLNARALAAYALAEHIAAITERELFALPTMHHNSYNDADLVFYSEDVGIATDYAVSLNDSSDKVLCVFGSLYLIGVVRQLLLPGENTEQ